MIDQITIDKIMDAADIVEVVSDFVSLRKRGVNYIGLCPFHDEKTPSFSVSPSKGICKCFSCGKGGTAVHFIMEHEQMTYYEALKYLANKYHIEIAERELSEKEKVAKTTRESMLIVNEFAKNFFSENLLSTDEGRAIGLAYFKERGFREDIINKFGLGYSPEKRDALAVAATKGGYNKEYLIKTGLCIESQDGNSIIDRFRGRVIFPVYSLAGKVIAFGGRILKTNEKTAKYLNSPESEVYHKSNVLYGIFQAKSAMVKQNNCFLVEGYTDVLSMHQAGIENVVASSGTSLTNGQIRQIHRFTENITVLYDGDAAGIKASLRGIDMLLEEGMKVKVVLLPDGDDPDSFAKKQSATEFTEYIKRNETDFITFKTNLLIKDAGNDPLKRAGLINDIVQSIAVIPDEITRSVYIKECSRIMEMREDVLLKAVATERLKKAETGSSPAPMQQESAPITAQDEHPVSSPTPIGIENVKSSVIEAYERKIVRFIIKYGFTPMINAEGNMSNVLTFILSELNNDGITFTTEIYSKIVNEALELQERLSESSDKEIFTFEQISTSSEKEKIRFWKEYVNDINQPLTKHFLNHREEVISKIAVDLISEKYRLSRKQTMKSEEERIVGLARRIVTELKDAVVSEHIKQLNLSLKTAFREKDNDKIMPLLKELNSYNLIKKELAKELGERVVSC
ncbi:MAG: DNA primase [Bacteroidales bacterium]|nr:DNA primase [Bacteroidales bacterium]